MRLKILLVSLGVALAVAFNADAIVSGLLVHNHSNASLGGSTLAPSSLVVTGTAGAVVASLRGSGGDRINFVPGVAGAGGAVAAINNAGDDYEPLTLDGETVALRYRTGVGTVAQGALLNTSGNFVVNNALAVDGNTTLGNASGDTLTIAPNTITWSNNPTHSGNHTFSGSLAWGTGTATHGLVVKRKTADESVTSNTTPQDDDHLTFTMAANEEWEGIVRVSIGDALSTTGLRILVNAPSGATIRNDVVTHSASTAFTTTSASLGSVLVVPAANFGSLSGHLFLSFWVLNGATPGSATVQWAQNTSSGSALTLKKGGTLVAHRVQ